MALTLTQPKGLTPAKFETELVDMDNGVLTNLPPTTSLTINGNAQKQPAIDTQLKGYITAFKAVDTAKQAYQDAVKARLALTIEARDYYKALKAAVKSFFGAQSAQLASFGITPDKASSSTTKTKMVASAKRQTTRTLRGTKGKVQKAAITVVGEPAVSIASDGTVVAGAPTINMPASSTASSSPASAPASTPAPSLATPSVNVGPAPASSGSAPSSNGSSTPSAS
jgi:hypothetical protein